MTTPSTLQLTLDFNAPDDNQEKQEKLTQTLYQQLQKMDGVKVERLVDPNPPGGVRGASFLWGLLQTDVNPENLKNLFSFLGDRLGNKPIKIKAKFDDNREFEVEVSSRAELLAAEETIKRLAAAK
jgi:hypothetical protein